MGPVVTLTDALAKLHAAGRIRSPWLPGMQFTSDNYAGVRRIQDDRFGSWPIPDDPTLAPGLADPATVGCLLALLREAEDYPCWVRYDSVRDPGAPRWTVVRKEGRADGHTEGEAIAAALIALAEALP